MRVDLQNKISTLERDFHFQTQLYDAETEKLRTSKTKEIELMQTRIRDEYDSKLITELQLIRDETEYKLKTGL